MFNELNNIVKAQMESDIQKANLQAIQDKKDNEIRNIRNKYIDDSLFDGFRNELDNYKIQLGYNINNALKTKQGCTENLVTQVWDKGIGQFNKLQHEIDNLKNNIDLTKEQILSCTTLKAADESYNGIKDVIRIFKTRWVNEEKQLIQDWTNNLLELIQQEEINNPIQPNIPPVSNPNQINQLEQALKRIEELENLLNQSRQENQEQKNVIDGMRDELNNVKNDNIEKTNKVMELQGKLLEKTEQITVEINKYNTEHNKFIDTKHKVDLVKVKLDGFINNHEGIEDQLVDILGDLNINNDI